jgi:hypothetical protein
MWYISKYDTSPSMIKIKVWYKSKYYTDEICQSMI